MRFILRASSLVIALFLGLSLSLSLIGTASAHARVLDSIPGINSTIAQSPTTITVHTAENIDPNPQKSNLFVYGPSGELISQGNAKVSLNNPKEMSIGIKPASNGIYIVRWITASATDGDPDQGAFVFTVNPNAGKTASPASSNTGQSTTNTGVPLALTIGIGVLALLIGLGAGLAVARRTARPSLATMRREVAEQENEAPRS